MLNRLNYRPQLCSPHLIKFTVALNASQRSYTKKIVWIQRLGKTGIIKIFLSGSRGGVYVVIYISKFLEELVSKSVFETL